MQETLQQENGNLVSTLSARAGWQQADLPSASDKSHIPGGP